MLSDAVPEMLPEMATPYALNPAEMLAVADFPHDEVSVLVQDRETPDSKLMASAKEPGGRGRS